MKDLCDILTALSFYLRQAHLCASNSSYSLHLLTEQLQQRAEEDIDRLKELYISTTGDLSIANAQESLQEAAKKLRIILEKYGPATNKQETIAALLEIEQWAISTINKELDSEEKDIAIKNALEDIAERRTRDIYLLNTERDREVA